MARKQLYQGQPTDASAVVYTAPAKSSVTIASAVAFNGTGAGDTISVWITPASGTADNTTGLIKEKAVGTGASVQLSELIQQTLEDGQELHLQAGTAATVTVTISGDVS